MLTSEEAIARGDFDLLDSRQDGSEAVPGAPGACRTCVVKVIPALIACHAPVCTQSPPRTLRPGLINIFIIGRTIPQTGDEVCSRARGRVPKRGPGRPPRS